MIGSDWNDITTPGLLIRRISLKSESLLMLAFSTNQSINQSINEVGITSSSLPKVTLQPITMMKRCMKQLLIYSPI
jgi:hypothetical protein